MNFPAWQYYFNFYRGSIQKLFIVIVISAGQSLVFLLIAFFIRYSFDEVISVGDNNLLILIGVILLLLVGVNNVLRFGHAISQEELLHR